MGYKLLVFGYIVSMLLIIAGIMLALIADNRAHLLINSKMTLQPSSYLYKEWVNSSNDVYLNFYLFNLKNPSEFESGSKPDFEQIGPFVFKVFVTKEDIIHNDNYTITYKLRKRFDFVQELSPYELEYPITTINLGPITIENKIKYKPSDIHDAVNMALKMSGDTLLVKNMSARNLIFGYQDKFLTELKKIFPSLVPSDIVGFFINKNNTIDGVYTVFTGEDDYRKVGIIDAFNYEIALDVWPNEYANMLNGSDGSIFPRHDDNIVHFYQPNLCRSIYSSFNKKVKIYKNLKLKSFAIDNSLLANVSVKPDNGGFCSPADNCLPSGLLNITNCLAGNPLIISFPHFLFGDDKLIKDVNGLKPNYTEHHTQLFYEPNVGVLMKANKRFQINTKLFRDPRINLTINLPEVMYPLFWIDENFQVDEKIADKIYHKVQMPVEIVEYAKFIPVVIGLIILFICFVYDYFDVQPKKEKKRKSKHDIFLINNIPNEYHY